MNVSDRAPSSSNASMPNGSGAAAILAAGVGSFALAVLAIAGDKSASVKAWLVFYKPTGPLSGVTTLALIIWILTWGILEGRWRKRTVAARTSFIALALLGLSLLLTFPPIVDLF